MIKLLILILLVWIITKIINYFSFISSTKQDTSKKTSKDQDVYEVGCLGKIINFNETGDGRFLINLSGIIRFRIIKELDSSKLYRKFSVDYSDFLQDLKIEKDTFLINYLILIIHI